MLSGELGFRPNLVVGDFSSTHPGTWLGRLLGGRAVSSISRRLPVGESGQPQSKIARVNSLTSRLAAMTSGHTTQAFIDSGYVDLDGKKRRPTMLMGSSVPVAQLDHMFLRCDSNARMSGEVKLQQMPLTDHLALRASFWI